MCPTADRGIVLPVAAVFAFGGAVASFLSAGARGLCGTLSAAASGKLGGSWSSFGRSVQCHFACRATPILVVAGRKDRDSDRRLDLRRNIGPRFLAAPMGALLVGRTEV